MPRQNTTRLSVTGDRLTRNDRAVIISVRNLISDRVETITSTNLYSVKFCIQHMYCFLRLETVEFTAYWKPFDIPIFVEWKSRDNAIAVYTYYFVVILNGISLLIFRGVLYYLCSDRWRERIVKFLDTVCTRRLERRRSHVGEQDREWKLFGSS